MFCKNKIYFNDIFFVLFTFISEPYRVT